MLLSNPDWTWEHYDDSLVALAGQCNPGNATADYFAAMASYLNNGGNVLMCHGQADGFIPTGSSEYFFQSVSAELPTDVHVADSFRLFLVPGMHHCYGTSVHAPWYVGGPNQAGSIGTSVYSVPQFTDSKHDAVMASMEWVEKGRPVDALIATAWNNDTKPASGVRHQRPLCPYPSRAILSNAEAIDDAESWVCQ